MIIPAQIRSDKDTIAKLQGLAGDKPVARFLREIANGSVPVPKIEEKLDRLSDDIRQLYDVMLMLVSEQIREGNPELEAKIDATGLDFDGKMLAEVYNNPELLDDKDWIARHTPESWDATDIEAYKKDYED